MEVVNLNDIRDITKNIRCKIGKGRTAYCYLLNNGKVLKLYRNTYLKDHLFKVKNDMFEHLLTLSKLKNDSYITPEEIVSLNDKVIGYIMDYKKANVIKKIKGNIKISDIRENYKKLEENTYKISKKDFRISDIHQKNILYGNEFYVIDLDEGYESMFYNDKLMNENMLSLTDTIINAMYGIGEFYDMYFDNFDKDTIYKKAIQFNYTYFYDFLDYLEKENEIYLKDLRREKRKKVKIYEHDNYYNIM